MYIQPNRLFPSPSRLPPDATIRNRSFILYKYLFLILLCCPVHCLHLSSLSLCTTRNLLSFHSTNCVSVWSRPRARERREKKSSRSLIIRVIFVCSLSRMRICCCCRWFFLLSLFWFCFLHEVVSFCGKCLKFYWQHSKCLDDNIQFVIYGRTHTQNTRA